MQMKGLMPSASSFSLAKMGCRRLRAYVYEGRREVKSRFSRFLAAKDLYLAALDLTHLKYCGSLLSTG
jgi:hypothetical protein